MVPAALKKSRMQVGAVQSEIGRAVTRLDLAPKRHGGEPLAGERVEQNECFGAGRVRLDGVERADGAQRTGGIGPELDAGTTLVGETGALQHARGPRRQREAQGKPANAAAGDEDGICAGTLCLGRCAQASGAPAGAVASNTQPAGSLCCRLQGRIVDEKGRAIGADDLPLRAHIEVDMGMVERRARAHALEFLDADADLADAAIVDEMGDESWCHGSVVRGAS